MTAFVDLYFLPGPHAYEGNFYNLKSWAAPRRRLELHVFKMVAKIRGFFGSYSKFYVGKFLLQIMKIKNISRQSLKIQISSSYGRTTDVTDEAGGLLVGHHVVRVEPTAVAQAPQLELDTGGKRVGQQYKLLSAPPAVGGVGEGAGAAGRPVPAVHRVPQVALFVHPALLQLVSWPALQRDN